MMGLFAVTIDASDASGLARFYADLTGMQVSYDGPEGALISAEGRSLMFQQVSDYNPPRWPDPAHPQQAHLDLLVEDLDTGQAQALELGASRLNAGGERFRVFADPAGHPGWIVSACRSVRWPACPSRTGGSWPGITRPRPGGGTRPDARSRKPSR